MASYAGDVTIPYDRDLGPVLFQPYAIDIARRATQGSVRHLLKIAAGTGVVTRQLRDALPRNALLTAIDISDSMMDVARAKFLPHEQVTFQIADAVALPFDDDAFGGIAQFEREMMLERQREGIIKAKAAGKYKGRKPKSDAIRQEVVRLAGERIAKVAIARQLNIGEATVYRILVANSKEKSQTRN